MNEVTLDEFKWLCLDCRDALGYTQARMAAYLGVSRGALSHYETARNLPKKKDLPRIIKLLNKGLRK